MVKTTHLNPSLMVKVLVTVGKLLGLFKIYCPGLKTFVSDKHLFFPKKIYDLDTRGQYYKNVTIVRMMIISEAPSCGITYKCN